MHSQQAQDGRERHHLHHGVELGFNVTHAFYGLCFLAKHARTTLRT